MTAKDEAFKAFDAGKRTSDIKGLAKPKTLYNYFDLWKKSRGIVEDAATPQVTTPPLGTAIVPQKEAPKEMPKKELPKANPDIVTKVSFQPQTLITNFTPTMMIARRAAITEWGIPEDTRFDDFLDAVLSQFFEDRGITIAAYVVKTSPAQAEIKAAVAVKGKAEVPTENEAEITEKMEVSDNGE